MAKKGNGKSTRNNRPRSVAPQQRTVNPPVVVTAGANRLKLRFKVGSAASSIGVTRACLLSLLVSQNENLATSVVPVITGIKLNKISLWIGGGTPGSVDITWLSDLGMDKRATRAWMAGLPAAMQSRPPRGSRAAMWSRADSTAATLGELLFVCDIDAISSGTNTVLIDIDCSVVRADVNYSNSLGALGGNSYITIAGLTAVTTTSGTYVCALDSISPGVLTKGAWNAIPMGVQPLSSAQPTTFTRVES
jgi:hypothetical protein